MGCRVCWIKSMQDGGAMWVHLQSFVFSWLIPKNLKIRCACKRRAMYISSSPKPLFDKRITINKIKCPFPIIYPRMNMQSSICHPFPHWYNWFCYWLNIFWFQNMQPANFHENSKLLLFLIEIVLLRVVCSDVFVMLHANILAPLKTSKLDIHIFTKPLQKNCYKMITKV